MELIRGCHNLRPRHHGCVATIGNFDGLHRGHQAVLAALAERSRRHGLPAVVVSFEPHPREYFAPDSMPSRLSRLRDKILALRGQPVDRLLLLPFGRRLAEMTAEDFVEALLVRRLGVRALVVGDDFRFGHRRQGDIAFLESAGRRHGFEVLRMAGHVVEGRRVSSTAIREALRLGDLSLAERLLGRPFRISGRVVVGDRRGRALGFPTANIHWPVRHGGEGTLPLQGVFAATVEGLERPAWPAVVNVGRRPTVDGRRSRLEVHLLDFSGDLYGCHLTTVFHHRIRDERRFDGLDELRAQIGRDSEQARAWLAAASPAVDATA